MKSRAKIFVILAIVVMVSFACGKSTPKPTSTPAIDTAATAAAQVAAEKATAKAQAALDQKATADAQATVDAKNAQATADKAAADKAAADKATADAKTALDAKATADALAILNATSTAEAQAALDAQATADAKAAKDAAATATQAAKLAAQQATKDAASAQSTAAAEAILSKLKDEFAKINMSTDVGKLGWIQSGSEKISMDPGNKGNLIPFAKNLVASDFVLKTEVTWNAEGGLLICGFIFRSEPNLFSGTQYQLLFLRLSGAPGWDIETYKNGAFFANVTGKIRFASAIKMDNGATNKFVLIAEGNKFTVYINDQRIGSFFDDSKVRSDGQFAFVGMEEAGESSCEFNNSWVWLLK